jgi:hypothetical protein
MEAKSTDFLVKKYKNLNGFFFGKTLLSAGCNDKWGSSVMK